MEKILVIDDDRDMCMLLKGFLSRHGYEVETSLSGRKALELLDSFDARLVITDFRLEDTDGLQLLQRLREKLPTVQVIVMTGYSDIKLAVEVMKMGAFDYVTKPLLPDEILITIKKALAAPAAVVNSASIVSVVHDGSAEGQKDPTGSDGSSVGAHLSDQGGVVSKGTSIGALKGGGAPNSTAGAFASATGKYILGTSPQFQQIMKQVALVAPTNFSVIIYGESGSGKEAIAQEIHALSKRKNAPFVAIDCGALSKELAGSELFGHEKGSFTGALQQKVGSFELANGGTIFLDEIANLPYDVQVSLLRVVQERKMRRIGGGKDIELDVRILVASNERLLQASRSGKFREDLFHRFNEFSIDLPPLRERPEDIMTFANHFLAETNRELNKNVQGFSQEVAEIFKQYVWFGNVRELKNVVKRATLLADGPMIESRYLPFEISNHQKLNFHSFVPAQSADFKYSSSDGLSSSTPTHAATFPANAGRQDSLSENFGYSSELDSGAQQKEGNGSTNLPAGAPATGDRATESVPISLKNASIDAEYEAILAALKQVNFNKSKAAKLLNIDRKTLYNKMKQYQELNASNG